ncbi:cold-shock protein [Rhodoplanes serenus]|uniref:Cold-shock protein n=1 Tax=Rhodoplanes serenus TaxID=200615 RepID=A0A327KI02_9BRAD|nr:cold-shock protein [Rhodoplanes serenus]MTW19341.1 cold-shock protein [Rhodoplanes serenus]RAI34908.1 cold-shock protein [Rhodoplanes serenus]
MNGTVKWFDPQKGYGFIMMEGAEIETFVHRDAIERAGLTELREGQMVTFEIVTDLETGRTWAERLTALD